MAKTWYRAQDGLADYKFEFHRDWWSGEYKVYIDSQPSCRSRDTSLHATDRLVDGSRDYVCWTDPITGEEDARRVAALWADKTQEYIKAGRRFDGLVCGDTGDRRKEMQRMFRVGNHKLTITDAVY